MENKLQIIDCVQGSEEWFIARLGVPSASNFSKIVTSKGELSKTIKEYAIELASQCFLTEPEESYKNADMQRGNDLEPEARELYQQHTFNSVDEIGFMIKNGAGYSTDGSIKKDGLLEIKCPKANTHAKYLHDDKLPTTYFQQCQGGLHISGREWIDFVSYHPNFKDGRNLFIKRVYRDEEFIAKLDLGLKKVIELRDEICNKICNKNKIEKSSVNEIIDYTAGG